MDFPPQGHRTCLYTTAQLESVLDHMAWQAAGFIQGKARVVIVGIVRRGAPLAQKIYERLEQRHGFRNLEMMQLKIKRYDDDLTLLHPETQLIEDPSHVDLSLHQATVLVVDDVMYQGHSMLRAVEYLAVRQAAEIRTVVLVDRGSNKLPVRTDITGVRLDVAPTDIIECNVPPYESIFKIELLKLKFEAD